MALEELKQDWEEADQWIREYVEQTKEYYQLRMFRFLMHLVDFLCQTFILAILSLLVLIFFSVALSHVLGELLNHVPLGFMLVGLLYILLIGLFMGLRGKLSGWLIKRFSTYYFDMK